MNIKWQKKKQIYKNFTNVSQEKLNTINNKKLMSKIMLWQLLLNDEEKKKQEV